MSHLTFQRAFAKTIHHEGTFSNDPDDPGKMTYMGISRRYWPEWGGWLILDDLISVCAPIESTHEVLMNLTINFYRKEFWNKLECDAICYVSQDIAIELFDTAVNISKRKATEIMQEALNLLNINQKLYPDIEADGKFGKKTVKALEAGVKGFDDEIRMVKVMNILQGEYYVNLLRADPAKEKWRGWFARA